MSCLESIRREILTKLQVRNREQCHAFRGLVQQYQEALAREQQITDRAMALERENEQLRSSLSNGSIAVSTTTQNAAVASSFANNSAEIVQLKAELTDAYKRNSEAVREQLRLSQELKQLGERRADMERELGDLRSRFSEANSSVQKTEEELHDKEATISVLRGELQSLQLEYVAREDALKKLTQENERLVDRWIKKMEEESQQIGEASRMYNQLKEAQQQQQQQAQQQGGGGGGGAPSTSTSPKPQSKNPFAAVAAMASSLLFEKPPELLDTPPLSSGKAHIPMVVGVVIPTTVSQTLASHSSDITGLCYNIGGTILASCSNDKTIKLWDVATKQVKATFIGSAQGCTNVAISLNDEMILGCSNDNAARIWNIQGARLRHTLTGHVGKVSCGIFVDTAQRVITGSHDRTIKIWDLVKGYAIKTMFCMSSCNDCCLTAGGTVLASAHVDKGLRLWDLASGTNFEVFDNLHEGQITCVTKSSDGRLLLTSGRDNVLYILDPNTKEKVMTFKHEEYRNGLNWSRCCFSPDGRFVVAGSVNGSIFVWSTATTKMEKMLVPPALPQVPAVCVAWNPTGSSLAASCKNDISIWS